MSPDARVDFDAVARRNAVTRPAPSPLAAVGTPPPALSTPPPWRARWRRWALAAAVAVLAALAGGVAAWLANRVAGHRQQEPDPQPATSPGATRAAALPNGPPAIERRVVALPTMEVAGHMPDSTPKARDDAPPASEARPRRSTPEQGEPSGRSGAAATTEAEPSREEATPAPDARESGRTEATATDAQPDTEPDTGASPEPDTEPEALPSKPSRAQMQHAMAAVRDDVRSCADAKHGGHVVPVEVTVHPDGRVAQGIVTGRLAGTPEGSCIARAVRNAQVPRFGGEAFVVRYPFRL